MPDRRVNLEVNLLRQVMGRIDIDLAQTFGYYIASRFLLSLHFQTLPVKLALHSKLSLERLF
jgi:hypothetical protein